MNSKEYILGISCHYHDSSACLIKNGEIIAAASEERFSRIKHDNSFPLFAIEFCLHTAKIDIDQIYAVCFYEKPFRKLERILTQVLKSPFSFEMFRSFVGDWFSDLKYLTRNERDNSKYLKQPIFRPGYKVFHERFGKLYIREIIKNTLKHNGPIYFTEHHLAHSASSYFTSPFQKAAIVNIDGVGEWTTTSIGMGKNSTIKLYKAIHYPHSLGLFYSTITALLGFKVNNSEYKVMGLGAYGNQNRVSNPLYKKLRGIIDLKEDGSFNLDMTYFAYHRSNRMASRKLYKLLGCTQRFPTEALCRIHYDIAAAAQLVLEEIALRIINYAFKITQSKNLCFSGGVALNSVLNGKLTANTPFEHIHIHPAAGDEGGSLGAALFCHYQILGNTNPIKQVAPYLGPEFSNIQIEFYLKGMGIKYVKFEDKKELILLVGRLIVQNAIIGWFQGRMEWGPRALGARSILANAQNPGMKDILNKKVKHREAFRPFAPAVCEEDVYEYFDCPKPLPHAVRQMSMVYPLKQKWVNRLSTICHQDASSRIQVVDRSSNSDFYELIKTVGELSGIPMVINTSFNVKGEPIVCSPDDAYRCMMGTQIDFLIMGNFLIERTLNLRDSWEGNQNDQALIN